MSCEIDLVVGVFFSFGWTFSMLGFRISKS